MKKAKNSFYLLASRSKMEKQTVGEKTATKTTKSGKRV